MLEKIKKIFKKKPKVKKEKRTYEKAIDHSNDITFENEIKKPEVKEIKETVSETKAETKSSLTFGE
jgi:hypothetical protein|tara:strand:+ start:194 stop:391 length:198 start_codon:yes stop_codon:yes gene_type:complete